MEIILQPDDFENNEYHVRYGSREALFILIDEEFQGSNTLGRINRINIIIAQYDDNGKAVDGFIGTSVIGFGDGIVGIRSDEAALRGKILNKDNMEQCVVELYE
jgi:hypothetical protein